MVRHFNPSLAQNARRILATKGDGLTAEIAEKLIPIVPITSVCNYVKYLTSTATGTAVVATTPTDKDLYITAIQLAFAADAAADAVICYISVFVNGVEQIISQHTKITLTAYSSVPAQLILIPPLLVDRGSAINSVTAFTVGTTRRNVIIIGYTVETMSSSSQ